MIGNAADSTISFGSVPHPISDVLDIIRHEMLLQTDQVFLWQKNFDAPMDLRLYVAVRVGNIKPFSNQSQTVATSKGMQENQAMNLQAQLVIDIFSRDIGALLRKEEVFMALRSNYSQGKQHAGGFYIAPLPTSFVDLSGLERSAIPYRFTAQVALHYKITKASQVDYYSSFSKTVLSED